ncbi:MAG: EpsI family protein [candidate division Zixibacteria bacterium]|nr:EpsI family protein [candidate division Zixibacteria bacterium]MDH3938322.1 EpsI family protein [candidate division Zixibacteria bacterium]MDH4033676.1 EpsI family protein [candidate division Zixibacteria bacterium]
MKAAILSAMIILVGGIFGNYLRFVRQSPDRPPTFDSIPLETSDYYGQERRLPEFNYEVLQADTTTLRLYRDLSGTYYWLFVAYFASQEYGSQMHSPRQCLPGGGWRIRDHQPFTIQLQSGENRTINRLVIAQQNSQQLMYYWYETRGGALTGEYAVKWDLAVNSLLLRPTDAAFVRLTLPLLNGDLEAADRVAVEFLRQLHPHITQALPFHN